MAKVLTNSKIVAARWNKKVYLIERRCYGKKIEWWWYAGTGGYMKWPRGAKILKSYSNDIDDVFLTFHREYPLKPSKPKKSGGWLAPNGDFYPCEYMEHISTATHLADQLYDGGDSVRLELEGWGHIYDTGHVGFRNENHATQKQVDTMFDLAMTAEEHEEYRQNMLDNIELAKIYE